MSFQPHLKEKQAMLESTLVSIIVGSQSSPPPGRAIRQSVARCLIALYNRGETRTLFDTVQAFLKIINDFKTPDREFYKMSVAAHKAGPSHLIPHQRSLLVYWRPHASIRLPGPCLFDSMKLTLLTYHLKYMSFMSEIATLSLKTLKSSTVNQWFTFPPIHTHSLNLDAATSLPCTCRPPQVAHIR